MPVHCFESRRKKILMHLRTAGEADVADLVARLGASEATIRRDLLELEREGLLVRTFGGARAVSEASLVARTFDQRRSQMSAEKERIATEAAKLVEPGMSVMIDSGTTCHAFAEKLVEKVPLQVITSALPVIEALGEASGIELIVCGGRFRLANLDFIDSPVDFSSFHADLLVLGCDSMIPGRGVFSYDMQSAAISRQMAAGADRVIILGDHTKIGKGACHRILTPDEIACFYTTRPEEEVLTRLLNDPFQTVLCDDPSMLD